MNTRPKRHTIAAILWFINSVIGVISGIPQLTQGATAFNQTTHGPPYVIIVISTLIATMGIVSAYGVWRNQKWGIVLTIVLSALNGLSALPGVIGAPTVWVKVFAASGVVFSGIIIALLLWPKPISTPVSRRSM